MTSLFFTKLHVYIFLFPYIFNLNSKFYCEIYYLKLKAKEGVGIMVWNLKWEEDN